MREKVIMAALSFFVYIFEKRGGYMNESVFQRNLIIDLKKRFEGCVVIKNDASYIQGVPDLIILYGNKWAALECKQRMNAKRRPNQEYYVGALGKMSFARFICPENKEEILSELQQAFLS